MSRSRPRTSARSDRGVPWRLCSPAASRLRCCLTAGGVPDSVARRGRTNEGTKSVVGRIGGTRSSPGEDRGDYVWRSGMGKSSLVAVAPN
jgi:hypothetical protein